MKTKLTYILLLFVCIQTYSQRKYAANRYFSEYAYKKSADLYSQIYQKGDSSKFILERLADSYYYNTDTKNAEGIYNKLINNFSDEVTSEYYFRYAQSLKSNGKYKLSDEMMMKIRSIDDSDSRAADIEKTPDYLSIFSQGGNKIISLHNLAINTKYSDYGGFLHGDELYYASTKPGFSKSDKIYKWNNQPFYDLYKGSVSEQVIEKTENSSEKIIELIDEKIIKESVNTRYHDASAVITKDGSTMYFTRDNFDGKKIGRGKNRETHLKIYKAELVNGNWDNIKELPFSHKNYSIGHPALSPDEKTLYFTSDMPGGVGYTDIYKVSINGDNTYGKPENLGKEINTEGREMFPFVSADNILYFSSDGHLGLGALDIFETKIDGDSFSAVKNIEAPFNSNLDDFSFTVNKEKTKGFFTSNREGGKGDDDIYSFKFEGEKKKVESTCVQYIAGVVTDSKTGAIITNATVKLIDKNGAIINTVQSDNTGTYSFGAECNNGYKVLGEKNNYTSDRNVALTTDVSRQTIEADLALVPLIIDREIVINPIFFDFDKYNIREEATYELEKVVTVMQNNPDMIIKIESHTDSRAPKGYNIRLSDNRAKSTRDYIISRGIESYRIQSAIGYGESRLLNHCNDANINTCSEEEHQRNRRSKFIIVSGANDVRVNDPSIAPLHKIDRKPGK